MTRQEFALIAMSLKTYFPKERLIPNDRAMELWFFQLKDLDYKTAEAALNKWVATNKWSPSIAELREAAAELTQGEIPDWGEAWEKVLKAVWHWGSYEPEKAMESFDEITRQAVKRVGYRDICMSENISVERANFRMVYETIAARKKQDAQIPPQIQGLIQKAMGGDTQQAIGTKQEEEEA